MVATEDRRTTRDMPTSHVRMLPELREWIDEALARWHIPGAAVGIVRDQDLAWSAGFGYSDMASGRQPDEHTLYRVGSITKTFTATAIVQLRDEGRLDLDDPLVRFIPEFASARNRFGTVEDVTLRRLLTHHSGLMGEPPLSHWETLEFPSIEEILASLTGVEVSIEPDGTFKYSNLAFSLLGEVVARVSGRPYIEYVHTEILGPLGMAESAFALTDALQPRMATGYTPNMYADHPSVAPHPIINGMTSAGQLYSTVSDLARWIALQFRTSGPRAGAQVLAGRSIAEMHRPQYLEPGWTAGYCLSWMALRKGDNVYVGHGGGIHGFVTQILFNEEQKVGAIVLTNSVGPTGEIALEVMERVTAAEKEHGRSAPRQPSSPCPAEWERFLGQYVGALGGPSVRIEHRGGSLVLVSPAVGSAPPLPPAPLDTTDQPHVFQVRIGRYAGEPLTFRLATDGSVTGFTASGFSFKRLMVAGDQ